MRQKLISSLFVFIIVIIITNSILVSALDSQEKTKEELNINSKQLVALTEGVKESVANEIGPEKANVKEETALLEGTKEGVSGEVGPEKNRTTQPIAPLEGTKEIVGTGGATESDCKKYLAECEAGNNILCIKWGTNCREKEEVTVGIKDEIKFKDERIYFNDKEVKVMPETASETAIQTLKLKKEVQIDLKDTGKSIYEIDGKKDVKLLGLINVEMPIKVEISAENGEIGDIEEPWWSFLVGEKEALEEIGGATGRDCEEYLEGCNSGDEVLCIKWETNCKEENESDHSFGSCKSLIYKGDIKSNINFVLVPSQDAEDNEQELMSNLSAFFDETGDYSFFSVYPYSDYKDDFNIFYLSEYEYLNDSSLNINTDTIKNILKEKCPILSENIYQVLTVEPLSVIFGTNSYFKSTQKVKGNTFPFSINKPYIDNLHANLHELGHSFGGLDEGYAKGFFNPYSYPASYYKENYYNNSNLPANWDIEGCPKWCSGQINISSVCYTNYLNYKECVLSPQTITSQEAQVCLDNFNNNLISKGIDIMPYNCNFGVGCVEDTDCWIIGMPFFRAYDEDMMYSTPSIPFDEIISRGYGPSGNEHIKQTIELLKTWNYQKQSIDYVGFEVINSSLIKIDNSTYKSYIHFKLTDSENNNIVLFTDSIIDNVFEIKSKRSTETEYFLLSPYIKITPDHDYELYSTHYITEKDPPINAINFIFTMNISKFEGQWNYSLITD